MSKLDDGLRRKFAGAPGAKATREAKRYRKALEEIVRHDSHACPDPEALCYEHIADIARVALGKERRFR